VAIPSGGRGNEIVFSADVIVRDVLNVFNCCSPPHFFIE
jgi:hypothetical protein